MSEASTKAEPLDDATLFLEAVKTATPLADRERVAATGANRFVPRKGIDLAPAAWIHESDEICGTVRGRLPQVSETHLNSLERGRVRPTREIDLHRMTLAKARSTLARAVSAASQSGVECLLVIHGKGNHSNGAAVLRHHLPELVASVSAFVRAYASALPRDGGTGATYFWIHRK